MSELLAKAFVEIHVDQSRIKPGFNAAKKSVRKFATELGKIAGITISTHTTQGVKSGRPAAAAAGKQTGKAVAEGVNEGVESLKDLIARTIADAIKHTKPEADRAGKKIGDSLSKKFKQGVIEGTAKGSEFFGSFVKSTKKYFDSTGLYLGGSLAKSIGQGIKASEGYVIDPVLGLVKKVQAIASGQHLGLMGATAAVGGGSGRSSLTGLGGGPSRSGGGNHLGLMGAAIAAGGGSGGKSALTGLGGGPSGSGGGNHLGLLGAAAMAGGGGGRSALTNLAGGPSGSGGGHHLGLLGGGATSGGGGGRSALTGLGGGKLPPGGGMGAAGAGGRGRGIASGLAGFGRSGLAAVGVGSVAFLGVQALKTAAHFEDAMTQVQINSSATEKELASLRDEALRIGRTTMFTPGDAAEAMNIFAKAGFEVRETMLAAAPAVNLATASNEGLERSTKNITRMLKVWNIDASRASDVADVLTSSMQMTGATSSEVADGLAEVGAVARIAGMDMKEAAATFAFLRERGHSASKAAIGLSTIIQRLHRDARPMRMELERLQAKGLKPIEEYKIGGNIDIMEFLRDLQKIDPSLDSMTKLFGVRGRQIAKLMKGEETLKDGTVVKGFANVDMLAENINRNKGATERAMKKRMSNVVGIAKDMWASIQETFIIQAKPLFAMMMPIMKAVTVVLDFANRFLRLISPVITALGKVVGILVGAIFLAGWISSLIGITKLTEWIVAGFKLVYSWAKKLSDKTGLTELFTRLTKLFSEVFGKLAGIWSILKQAFSVLWTALKNLVKGFFMPLKVIVKSFELTIMGLVGAVNLLLDTLEALSKAKGKYWWLFPAGLGLLPSGHFGGEGGKDRTNQLIGDLGRAPIPEEDGSFLGGGLGRVGFAELGNRFQDAALGRGDPHLKALLQIVENTKPEEKVPDPAPKGGMLK